ncbi:MAG TPA: PAS domain S-box protein, partial [Candidatus Sericytochromatia bacterium]
MNVIADQNEVNRLAALQQYQIVETPPEETFDAIARLAAQICQTPVAVINFIDDRLQWFKAHIGLEITHMPPKIGLCSRCIHLRDGLVIPDTLADEQSRSNPVVNNYPYVRFYAGVPLIVPGEYSIGTLCVVDYKPRELKSEQLEALRLLSHQVVNQLEIRRNSLAEKAYFQTNSHLQINTHSGILTPVATQVEEIEISSMRTSQQIKTEVEQTLGFFPPFFSSALGNPHVFENLWQQTLSAYLNNPLSPIFKEKLSAYLSRYCSVPYCMIVHSSSLRPLGVEAREVLALLQASPPEETEINKHLQVLQAQPDLQTNLPAENSAIEESLLYCAIFIAVAKEEAEFYKFELRRLLGNINYQHLITFIAYVKTCHEWMEAYPEVMYEEDQRAINYLEPLISEEPGLAEFFGNYVEQVKIERQTLATRLAQLEERKRNEQALRRSEEKFRSLVEQTNDWVWEIDANAAFTYVSPQVQKIVGYEPADLIGKTTFDLMSVSESERFLLVIGEFLSKQAPFINLEKTLIHKNGNLVVLETSGSPMFDAQGVLLGYRGIARDVTERKRSEEALRRSEQRTRILNEAIPQQVWTARPNGALDYVNKRVLDYFERSFEEMIDGGWQSVIHPEDLPGCVEVWGKSLTTGEPYEIEFRLFKASVATYRWHLGRAVPIYDEDGRIVSWFGTNTDIHDRKLAEEERDRFFSLSLDNLAIANFDGYFTRLNPAWEETTGYTTEELLAQPYLSLVHPDDLAITTAESENLANGNP